MSTNYRWLTDAIPKGSGFALDLAGGGGKLRADLEKKGWNYINLDIQIGSQLMAGVCADAHALPFRECVFPLVIVKDALEHFENPQQAILEVKRVLKETGKVVIWVPFMHPFHGNDYYRYTPLGIKKLLLGFKILRFESPLWVFSAVGLTISELLKCIGMGFLNRAIRGFAWRLDRLLQPKRSQPNAFACAYLIVAEKVDTQ